MSQDPTLARRDLLRGAALLAGGASLGLLPTLAEAALAPKGVAPRALAPTLAFWNGRRFVATGSLRPASTPERVVVEVTSVGGGGLAALEALAPTPDGPVPFTLWVAPPAGAERTRALLPVSSGRGVVFAAYAAGGARHEIALGPGVLREGTFALVPGGATLGVFTLDAEDGPIAPHIRLALELA